MESSFLIRCHDNAQRWKYAISTGNFYSIRIFSIFLQISQKMVTFESYKPGLSERMISVDYMNALKHSKVRVPFFIHPA